MDNYSSMSSWHTADLAKAGGYIPFPRPKVVAIALRVVYLGIFVDQVFSHKYAMPSASVLF
jgi:hypothetical protein